MPGPFKSDVNIHNRTSRFVDLDVEISLCQEDLVSILEGMSYNIRVAIAKELLDGNEDVIKELVTSLPSTKIAMVAQDALAELSASERDDVMGYFCNHCAERETVRYAVDEIEEGM